MTASSTSMSLALVALIIIVVHILVSLSFTIVSFKNKMTKTAQNTKSSFHTWNSIFWLISFFVCIVLLIILSVIFKLLKQISDTPCPIQISNPGDDSRVRNSIKDVVTKLQKMLPKVKSYDSNATYLVITGKYITEWKASLPPFDHKTAVTQLFQTYPFVPLGTLRDSKIYGLLGNEIWPDFSKKDIIVPIVH